MSNSDIAPVTLPKTSALRGKGPLIASVIGLVFFFLAPFALIWNLLELSAQKNKEENHKAKRYARLGLALSVIAIAFWTPALVYGYHTLQQVVCKTNMFYGICYAFEIYHNDYKALPTPERWCDLLIKYADISPKGFCCPASDAVTGECTYAINEHVFEVPYSRLPGDIVLFFETASGKEHGLRTASIEDRSFFQFFRNQGDDWIEPLKDIKVFPQRWNQIGGPEIAAAYHHGKCHVVLLNGKIISVTVPEISSLRWTVE